MPSVSIGQNSVLIAYAVVDRDLECRGEIHMKKSTVIIIPTLNPDRRLITYVQELVSTGFNKILIIDDGSSDETHSIFTEILSLNSDDTDITVFVHAINLGKGRALKDGINYYLTHLKDQYIGCGGLVTVDSDGQHLIKDVIQIDEAIRRTDEKKIVLGCRDFDLDFVPFKSKFGNKLTRIIFRFCFGTDIKDTQTGLRGFTNSVLQDLLELFGERFEYETNVLIECVKMDVEIEQITIQTVYENENAGTHFDPIRDSYKIYSLILRRFFVYITASLSSFIIDCTLFWLFCMFLPLEDTLRIYVATIGARVVSSLYNYTINKNVVFESKSKSKRTFCMYYVLCLITMLVSGTSVSLLYAMMQRGELIIKCIVDTILFLCNYKVQQKFVFTEKKTQNKEG